MPRQVKYDDIPFEKITFNGKIFMYNTPNWNILYPIVDIIRALKPNTIICHKIGKGQEIIRTYGSQYNHRILKEPLSVKNDYLIALKMVKCIFIFSDTSDIIATNLINAAKTNKINYVCYSTLDSIYHFYSPDIEKKEFKVVEELITYMYNLFDLAETKKLVELFPEFEIITPEVIKNTCLEECQELLKKSEQEIAKKEKKFSTKIYDPHLAKLKKMERERIKVEYDDDVEKINKKMSTFNLLGKFLKK